MANLVRPDKGKYDIHMKFERETPMTDEDIVQLIGGPFTIIELYTDDLVLCLEDQDDHDLPINKTATSLCNIVVRGSVVIAEKRECDLSA